jgi:hypothetical protein
VIQKKNLCFSFVPFTRQWVGLAANNGSEADPHLLFRKFCSFGDCRHLSCR